MSSFQRRYDAASVLLISDKPEQSNDSNHDEHSQLIVSCPVVCILKSMIETQ